jgi:hypothetical protein
MTPRSSCPGGESIPLRGRSNLRLKYYQDSIAGPPPSAFVRVAFVTAINRFPGWNQKRTPGAHWVCFSCRKMFRKMDRHAIAKSAALCPQCRQPMIDMGSYFETPKHSNSRLWALMEELAETGYRFHTEASRAFLFGPGKTGARTPSTRAVMFRIRSWLANSDHRT